MWEYKRIENTEIFNTMYTTPIGELNNLGKEGWELVTIYGGHTYFKRFIKN